MRQRVLADLGAVGLRGKLEVREVRDLKKHFSVKGAGLLGKAGPVKAVDGISFTVSRAETLGLVGKSGCGKTTTSKWVLAAEQPTAVSSSSRERI